MGKGVAVGVDAQREGVVQNLQSELVKLGGSPRGPARRWSIRRAQQELTSFPSPLPASFSLSQVNSAISRLAGAVERVQDL